ncbi:MAG: ATP/GTP-binding protein [Chloroflexota bacterium]|nr:ATP/GTP-binding protein [Chloroflexota bacterium]MDE2908005.1 ATP/GTP-binding protein [Chloroflexota bacterium]
MLIRFTVENFLSFKDEVEFSMVAGLPRKHKEHVIGTGRGKDVRTLKTAILYGANAAGKSNLIKAMAFVQRMVVASLDDKQSIPVTPFRLDNSMRNQPSRFEFEIRCGSTAYIYGFEADSKQVRSEWLSELRPSSEAMLFERRTDSEGKTSVDLGKLSFTAEHDLGFMKYIETGTRENELYLKKTILNRVEYFKDVYEWFDDSLRFVFPNPRSGIVETSHKTHIEFESDSRDIIELFDLGIENVKLESSESLLPNLLLQDIADMHHERDQDVAIQFPSQNVYIFVSANKDVSTRKFMTVHKVLDDGLEVDEEDFELSDESDGTQRLFELSSAMLGLLGGNGDRVYIIDELDRRLHPRITKHIVDIFLKNSANQASQMIVTTHESSLLDLDLVRRDEIWFVEKNSEGISTLYSLEEYAPRYDVDVQKGYLQGRYGAIPIVPSYNVLEWAR